MYKFVKSVDRDNEYDVADVQIRVRNADIAWPDLMEIFVSFLHACGYIVGEGQFVQDSKLDEYIDTRARQSVDALVHTLADMGKLNELLVHPDAFIREVAKQVQTERKEKSS